MKRYKCNYCHRSCVLEYASHLYRPPDICPCNSRVVRVKWTPINKPPAPEGEIVEAVKGYGIDAVARTIQAAVDDLKNRIAIKEGTQGQLAHDFLILEKRVNRHDSRLDLELPGLRKRIMGLENRVYDCLKEPVSRKTDKPRAADDKGKWHELIPGKSVFSCNQFAQVLFCKQDGDGYNRGYAIWKGGLDRSLAFAHRSYCTWLFDLDFSCDRKGDC